LLSGKSKIVLSVLSSVVVVLTFLYMVSFIKVGWWEYNCLHHSGTINGNMKFFVPAVIVGSFFLMIYSRMDKERKD